MTHGRLRIALLVGFFALAASGVLAAVPPPRQVTVSYEILGTGAVEVRYENSSGALAAPAVVTLPWRTQFAVGDDVRFVTITAGRTAPGRGDVTCRITADGALIALDGLSGGYVQCTGAITGQSRDAKPAQ